MSFNQEKRYTEVTSITVTCVKCCQLLGVCDTRSISRSEQRQRWFCWMVEESCRNK